MKIIKNRLNGIKKLIIEQNPVQSWLCSFDVKIMMTLIILFLPGFFCNESFALDLTKLSANDSLSLREIIDDVVTTHPQVKQSLEAIKTGESKIELAKSGYLPKLDANASYTRLGPVSSINFGPESFQLYPANNYNLSLEAKQVIYDFGKTSSAVDMETQSREVTTRGVEQIKQKLASGAVGIYFNLVYLQEAIMIKDIELKNLNDHLDFINKKLETGSATSYEILSTQVKFSNTESQKTDLLSARKTQLAALDALLGLPGNTVLNLKNNLPENNFNVSEDSLVAIAFRQRDEILLLNEKTKTAELQAKTQDNSDNPMILAFANGGLKNGFFPDMFKMTLNYAVGVSVNVPIFDAFRHKNNVAIANSAVVSSRLETDAAKRNITVEVYENYDNMNAAKKKVEQFSMQVKHAEQAFELAKVNFKAGAITNMDLLDAQTNVSESRLLLLKANIDYQLSRYKLKYSLGTRLY